MFHVEKIHNRFESVNGEYYFDGEPITESQAAHLIVHYRSVVDALKKPWDTKDDLPEHAEPIRSEYRAANRG